MTPRHLRTALLAGLAVAISGTGRAQVKTGTPPFGSFSGGPDIINNANLNLHLSIPVRVKAGRGMPFSYVLSYDTSVWYPAGSVWTPVSNWGWRAITEVAFGYVTYDSFQQKCFDGHVWHYWNIYSRWTYHDTFGIPHTVGTPVSSWNSSWTCGCCNQPPFSGTGVSQDGSGYSASVDASPS